MQTILPVIANGQTLIKIHFAPSQNSNKAESSDLLSMFPQNLPGLFLGLIGYISIYRKPRRQLHKNKRPRGG